MSRRKLIHLHLSKGQESEVCMAFCVRRWLCRHCVFVCFRESQSVYKRSVVNQYHNLRSNQLVFNGREGTVNEKERWRLKREREKKRWKRK